MIALLRALFFSYMLFSSAIAYSQFSTNKQYHSNDTSRTFEVAHDIVDEFTNKLKEKFGEPNQSIVGKHEWHGVRIDPIASPCNITIKDGIISRKSNGLIEWAPFKNNKDKEAKLASLESNQSRFTEFILEDGNGINIIRNDELEENILNYLNSLMK